MHCSTSQRCLISFDDDPYIGIQKIISGGQDGADIAGLTAAFDLGIKTGGHCPRFFRTASGSNFELRDKFNLEETQASNYQRRTELNVKNSDATIRFASDFGSAGELLTLKCINKYNKPYFDVVIPQQSSNEETVNNIVNWILANKITVLNVAGNRDKYNRFGYHFKNTYEVMFNVLQKLKDRNGN